jgi:HAD superfamily hydrolase (TIGR01509 family)
LNAPSSLAAICFDAFGTLVRYGERLAPYRHLLANPSQKGQRRLPFLTCDKPVAEFAQELGRGHLLPLIQTELMRELAGLTLFDDVPPVLAQARESGLKLAVCSNLAAEYGPAVRALLPEMDAVFSYEVGVAKPNPMIYQEVCERLGCQKSSVLFIGDSLRCDVRGPLAFGMQARHLNRPAGVGLAGLLAEVLASDGR